MRHPLLVVSLATGCLALQSAVAQDNTTQQSAVPIDTPDTPAPVTKAGEAHNNAQLAPLIAEARKTYPAAKARFEKGLPPGYGFFVVTRLFDKEGRYEQVFVKVLKAENDAIQGEIASQIQLIKDPKAGDYVTVLESEIIDWTIVDPKGAEEGNVIGKFMDEQNARTAATTSIRPFDLKTIELFGRVLLSEDYLQRTAISVARKNGIDIRQEHVVGHTVTQTSDRAQVRFVRKTDNGLEAAFDVTFAKKSEPTLSVPEDRSLASSELNELRVRSLAMRNVVNPCSDNYMTALIKDRNSDGWIVWALAMPMNNGQPFVGGHYRFTINADGTSIVKRDALANSCLALSTPPNTKSEKTVGALVTHLVSDTPVESHVYLSLATGKPLFVKTSKGLWKVEQGRIELLPEPAKK